MPHIWVSELGQPMRRQTIVNWTLKNKLQRNFKQKTKPFIHGNASKISSNEMATILSREMSYGCVSMGKGCVH